MDVSARESPRCEPVDLPVPFSLSWSRDQLSLHASWYKRGCRMDGPRLFLPPSLLLTASLLKLCAVATLSPSLSLSRCPPSDYAKQKQRKKWLCLNCSPFPGSFPSRDSEWFIPGREEAGLTCYTMDGTVWDTMEGRLDVLYIFIIFVLPLLSLDLLSLLPLFPISLFNPNPPCFFSLCLQR